MMKDVLLPLVGKVATLTEAGYAITRAKDIYSVLKPDFAEKIRGLERALGKSRSDYTRHFIDNPALFSELPYGSGSELHSGWAVRQLDLQIIQQHLAEHNPQEILEVGSWNGWLSQHLAADGRQLTAIDYFQDEYDGLGAKKHYPQSWLAVQMDLADLSILTKQFDLIIVNHCLGFMMHPGEWLSQLAAMLQPGGVLIATGLVFYRNPQQKAREVQQSCEAFKARYGVDMFLHPTRGYLDQTDRQQLIGSGMQFQPYPVRSAFRKLLTLFPGRQKMEWGSLKRQS